MAYTPGNGSLLKVSISASFTTFTQQSKFGALKRKRARIDVTGLGDTFEVLKAGIKRADGMAFSGWYDPADTVHQYLETSMNNNVVESWKVVLADAGAAEMTFSGWLEDLTHGEIAVDGYMEISGIIVLTTNLTVTP